MAAMNGDRVGAVIVAAGRSERMGGMDKLIQPLAHEPLLAHTIRAFVNASVVDDLVIVASAANRTMFAAMCLQLAPQARVVLGGERRRDSVLAGVEALQDCEYVLVHDGARPLVDAGLIEAALEGAREAGAALCAVPVTDTVKRSDESGLVRGTISREGLWLAQTPQAFRLEVLLRAHASSDIDATDDAALVELMDEPVRLVMGSSRNLKVTTREDLRLAEALLMQRGSP